MEQNTRLLHLLMTAHGPSRLALRRYYKSGVGGEADMPRSLLNRREWTQKRHWLAEFNNEGVS